MRKTVLSLILITALAVAASSAQEKQKGPKKGGGTKAAPHHIALPTASMKWGPAPPGLPAGAQMAVLSGDPSKAGSPFTLAAKFPDGYTVPPHWHPTTENIVVTSGTLLVGTGDAMNESSMTAIDTGGFLMMPKQMHHSAKAKGASSIIVYGTGPFEITYVNPKDDPRPKTSQ